MTTPWPFVGSLLAGSLCSSAPWPYTVDARLGDLRPRFRVKQMLRDGCRAIARDGRVLLCADRPLDDLPGLLARLRLQTWHRGILPGEAAKPYGILLSVRGSPSRRAEGVSPLLRGNRGLTPPARQEFCLFALDLRTRSEAKSELQLEVGGGMVLDFVALSQN